MSGLEVIGAVAAVVSAFHGGAELVAHIKKKRRKRRGEQAYKENQLQDSLESGEAQVETRYAADCRELGEWVKRGDVIARDRLLHIAVVMQAEIIRSLQLAVKYENAILDLTVLHETSIMNRKDTMVTLDELKQRIIIMLPPERMQVAPPVLYELPASNHDSTHNLTPPDSYLPPGITIPGQHNTDHSRSSLSRFISTKRNGTRNSMLSTSGSSSGGNSSSGYSFLGNPIHQRSNMQAQDTRADLHGDIYQDIHETLNSFQGLNIDSRDTLAQLQDFPRPGQQRQQRQPPPEFDPADLTSHPAFAGQRNNMGNSHSQPHDSPRSMDRPGSTSSASAYSEYTQAPPPRHNQRPTYSQLLESQTTVNRNGSTSTHSDQFPVSIYSDSSHNSVDSSTFTSDSAFSPRTSATSAATSAATPTTPLTPEATPAQFSYSLFPQTSRKQTSPPPMMALPPPPPPPTRALPSLPPLNPSDQYNVPSLPPPTPSTQYNASGPFSPSSTSAPFSPTTPSMTTIRTTSTTPSSVDNGTATSNKLFFIPSFTRSNTSNSGSSTTTTPNMLTGRPCKENNYWGFCRGAWDIREDLHKGMSVVVRPEGMYNNQKVWKCKQCLFQGDLYNKPIPGKKKMENVIDHSTHESRTGIQYKYIFLAKSHVKRKSVAVVYTSSKDGGSTYGCVFCTAEGKSTAVYGGIEMLMSHVFSTHAKGMSEEVQRNTKCVVGRDPVPGEEWDICIPFKKFLADGTAVREGNGSPS